MANEPETPERRQAILAHHLANIAHPARCRYLQAIARRHGHPYAARVGALIVNTLTARHKAGMDVE